MRRAALLLPLVLIATAAIAGPLHPNGLTEPSLRLPPSKAGTPRVALTLDACGGRTDARILSALVEHRIPATIFATGLWLRRNPDAVAVLKAHPELFEVEDHGARHVPAIDRPMSVYGIRSAGSPEAVSAEVQGGAEALVAAGLAQPHWFRGATAKYTPSATAQISALGYRIAGYSINGDGGSMLGAAATEHHVEAARDGDVIIAHINQPTHPAGAGLVKGLLALKARGVVFVTLKEGEGSV
ncbi:polysaccharide deacetylase family protein [Mangrovibrevibacter kandeliae]|uniref:polysaccharide deacetylase family protein n=1 Tax=Mangrovibrevibacter kandeliae TaxID=2968473 RepID=UPI00389A0553